MIDQYGRKIDYMRVSVTDRCNLRCAYCMPDGIELIRHEDLRTYEELLHLCRIAVSSGIVKFKITGGEPLVRRGCTEFIRQLKRMPGVEQVTITTNGTLLPVYLEELWEAGIDGINISLDTLEESAYCHLTKSPQDTLKKVLEALDACLERGIKVKVNTVLLESTFESIDALVELAKAKPADVRLIELMPIGVGVKMKGASIEMALRRLKELLPDLHSVNEKRGNGPARYFHSESLIGHIGLIDAVSHSFCSECNRIRLTSTGVLKPCLCYDMGTDLGELLHRGLPDEALQEEMKRCIAHKPKAHCFSHKEAITERKGMNRIGG